MAENGSIQYLDTGHRSRLDSSLLSRSMEASTQTQTNTPAENKGTIIGAVCILMNAVLGASILNLSYQYSLVGITTAFEMEFFVAGMGLMTHFVLADAVERVGGGSYQQLVGIVCGRKFQMLAQVLLVVYTFGLCVATKITIGDQLQRICDFIDNSTDGVVDHHFYCDRHFLIPISSLLFILPRIWVRNMSGFGYVSAFSAMSVFYVVIAIVLDYFYIGATMDNVWYPKESDPITILSVLPVFALGFQCHMTSVPLYAELKNRSMPRYAIVLLMALGFTLSFYLTAGSFGLMTFGYDINADIILNYPSNSITITVGRAAITVAVCMSYPIMLFIGREALEDFIIMSAGSYGRVIYPGSEKRRVSELLIWFVLALCLALICKSIADVLSIVGSIAALFMFFFPGLVFWNRATEFRNVYFQGIAVFFMVFGWFIFLWNIIYNIAGMISK